MVYQNQKPLKWCKKNIVELPSVITILTGQIRSIKSTVIHRVNSVLTWKKCLAFLLVSGLVCSFKSVWFFPPYLENLPQQLEGTICNLPTAVIAQPLTTFLTCRSVHSNCVSPIISHGLRLRSGHSTMYGYVTVTKSAISRLKGPHLSQFPFVHLYTIIRQFAICNLNKQHICDLSHQNRTLVGGKHFKILVHFRAKNKENKKKLRPTFDHKISMLHPVYIWEVSPLSW